MRRKKIYVLSALLFAGLISACDKSTYQVGISTASIEPTELNVSLALAGYAGPTMGRFSITWELCSDVDDLAIVKKLFENQTPIDEGMKDTGIISLTESPTASYAVTSENILLERNKLSPDNKWMRIGYDNSESYRIGIRQIAYHNKRLYALTNDSQIYVSRHNSQGNLTASAIAIKKGGKTVVITAVDVCGLDYSFTNRVKEEVCQLTGIAKEAIMINCSHTHFAPVTQEWSTWGTPNQRPDSLYINSIVRNGIIQAISQALNSMTPSTLHFSRDTTNIGYNRSLGDEVGGYDNSVDIIRITPLNKEPESIIFITGCHPVKHDVGCGKFMLSANYPGYVRERLQEKGFAHALFLQATAGDINPKEPFKSSGKQLTADVMRGLEHQPNPIKGTVAFQMDSISIPLALLSPEELMQWKIRNTAEVEAPLGGYKNDISVRNKIWAEMMDAYYANGSMPSSTNIYIQTFDVGNWRIIGLSREATTQYGSAVKELFPKRSVSVLGYTNDVSSYMATDEHIKANKYEGCESFLWYGQPSILPEKSFNTIIERIKAGLRQ